MTSQATKYAQYIVDADAYLRKQTSNGSRIRVEYKEVAAQLGIGLSSASSALLALSRIPGSGLKCVKSGTYEFITPAKYPPELNQLKDNLRVAGRRPMRKTLLTEVLAYLRERPGQLVTIAGVTDDLDALDGSVSSILRRLHLGGFLEDRSDIGRGTYRVIPQEVPLREVRADDEPVAIFDNLSGVQRKILDRVVDNNLPNGDAALMSGPLPAKPTPATIAKNVTPVMQKAGTGEFYKQVSQTKSGKIVVQGPDGTLYYLVEVE